MSSVLGLIDIRGTFLFHEKDQILNVKLAKCLKELNTHYNVEFHLFSFDSHSSFSDHKHMGIPEFWENYGDLSGLSKEAILKDGLYDISKPNKDAIYVEGFDDIYQFFKQDPDSFKVVMNHYHHDQKHTFLLDDDEDNLNGARAAGITAISSEELDYIASINKFVKSYAAPK